MLLLALAASSSHAENLRVVGSLLQVSSLTAGQAVSGSITLYNDGAAPVEVVVYPTDVDEDESVTEGLRSNRAWLRFTPRRVTVDPGSSAEVPYRVEVPANAQVTGTFGSLLVIEPTQTPVWPPLAAAPPVADLVGYEVDIVTHVSL